MKRTIILKIVLTITVLLLPSFVLSQETYKFERMWPTLKQPWYFSGPEDIAIDSSGNIYIADNQNDCIQKFSSDGTFITKWGSQGDGEGDFFRPSGITVDADGNIYVADTSKHRIQKFSSDGTFISKWGSYGSGNGEFFLPSGITVDAEGNIYVADSLNHRIQKFTSDGIFIIALGSLGSGNGMFDYPSGIAVDADGNIYVADTENHRIQKLTSDGIFITKWGSQGAGEGDFFRPSGITVDADGNIYVADMLNHRIQKFSSDGTFITKWGSQGAGLGEFDLPRGIAIDATGDIHVVDIGNRRIQKFSSDGTFITKWGSQGAGLGEFDLPRGIAIDATGDIYVADAKNDRIQKFSPNGTFIAKWGSEGSGDGDFNNPFGIAVFEEDGEVYIYVVDTRNHRIQKLTSDGTFITKWGNEGSDDREFNDPFGIAVDADGNIYVADTENHRIQKLTSEGTFITKWGSEGSGDGDFNYPFEVAIDSDNNVYVSDAENHRIQKFSSDGTFITKWGSQGNEDGEFESPRGIAVDATGNIYVADTSNHRVQKFTSDGTYITKWGDWGTSPGQMNHPMHLAVSAASGNVHVADTYNNRIQVFKRVTTFSNPRAIIMAGRASSEDSLWDATQMCTNFAYRVLNYQGFTNDDIYYLSADTDLDLDGDGVIDVDRNAKKANLEYAITEWAVNENADNLVLYLNDHGGEDTFRVSETETLSSDELASWLDNLQSSISGSIIMVYEACESGSFVDDLRGNDRVIVTSTLPGEQAKFLSQGTISFSYFFWTHIFNGLSVEQSYVNASQVINFSFNNQNPQLSGEAEYVYIGSGVKNMIGEAPEIGSVSEPREIDDIAVADLYADDVTDPDGIARVWAVIWPPNYNQGSVDDPLLSLPTCELLSVGGARYEGTFDAFSADGTYHIAIYAMDGNNNTSIPKLTTVSRNYHLTRKAIIVAGEAGTGLTRTMIEKNAGLAYDALISQGYREDELYITGIPGFNAPEWDYLRNHITNTLATDPSIKNLDLVIYLIGKGDTEAFTMNDDPDILYASQLGGWLNTLQTNKPCRVTLIYDANKSGSFIPVLASEGKERILITSSGADGTAYFSEEGDVCFSSFFWGQVASGAIVYDAFAHAKKALSYLNRKNEISFSCYSEQMPLLEADGNEPANEEDDYQIARGVTIGIGMKFADDPPQIGFVSVEETESVVTISAWDITSTKPLQHVWAAIKPIGYCPGYSGEETAELPEVELLDPDGDGRYEGTYSDPINCYKINIYAMDVDGNTSLPKETKIYQTEGGDIYEVDDTHEGDDTRSQANVIVVDHFIPQPHNFHYASDEDWVKFYGLNREYYTILVENLGDDCKPIMELYYEDDATPIEVEGTILNNTVSIDFECLQDGVCYVKLYNSTDGEKTAYDLQIYHPYWPDLLVLITGRVEDRVSRGGIDGAFITTSGGGAAISVGGEYDLYQKPGDWTMAAQAYEYASFFDRITLDAGDQIIAKDIIMDPITTPECSKNSDCNDGVYCNGTEMCIGRTCSSSINPPCLDDGLFCNGVESCDEENNVCLNSGNPCSQDLNCDEDNDVCVGCLQDADCDDQLFCNGVESCVDEICQVGAARCQDDGLFCNGVESCDEESNVCLQSGNPCSEPTPVCDEENDICTTAEAPLPTILLQPDFCYQSRWFPLFMLMRIEGSDTHFDASSTVTFNPASALMALPLVVDEESIFIIGLLMPSWLTGPLDSLDVTVTTVAEEAYEVLNVELLPFILDEGRETSNGATP